MDSNSTGSTKFRYSFNFRGKVQLFIDMKCLNCGKEIPKGRKFCSRSCSASYNNVRRERKPWTEEQHQKNRKVQREVKAHCSYCGKELREGERFACKECQEYIRFQKLPNRLGFSDGTPKERYEAALSYIQDLYLSGESTLTLEKKLGIAKETIWYNLKKLECTRNFQDSQKEAILQGRKAFSEGNPRYIHGWHTSWEGFEGFYRSSYELQYAQELDEQKISYRIEYIPTFTWYWDSKKQERRIAKPDFYLPDTNEIVEIKSSWTYDEQNMRDKFKAYRERGFKPRLFLDKREIEI